MSTPSDTDASVKTSVEDELRWSPDVDESRIGVAVQDGAVSLFGEVEDNSARLAAERAALRVHGVTAVALDLDVRPTSERRVSEEELAKEVQHALTWADNVPDTVKATVEKHKVTLSGEADWDFQREAAERAVRHMRGVHRVDNRITLTPRVSADDTEERIRQTLARNAQLKSSDVEAEVSGDRVILTGTVKSFSARRQAEQAAWGSPNVQDVENRIHVRPWRKGDGA
ncbi:BON domain-containing protein [Microbacterium caowuchunii]|uniref:BON domain-containing protein n=1 Tax=Microbacterium caowuchunii TaxID=2614638 RepID=UPI001248EF13|nr:BON domain-containing protein [Microbacterium caowuchunii]QEW00323.1 BON domain-containing protein [Microbacterium caowuchunii]